MRIPRGTSSASSGPASTRSEALRRQQAYGALSNLTDERPLIGRSGRADRGRSGCSVRGVPHTTESVLHGSTKALRVDVWGALTWRVQSQRFVQVVQSLVTRIVVEHHALQVVGCCHGLIPSEDTVRRRLQPLVEHVASLAGSLSDARSSAGVAPLNAADECIRTAILLTVEYQDAFADLAEIYLEDSWVLDVAVTEHGAVFRLDAVLTPNHPRYHPPSPGEQHCYLRATLTVASATRSLLQRSDAPAATDASGEVDFGNIDVSNSVDWDGERAWEMSGDWGDLLTVEPSVDIAFE